MMKKILASLLAVLMAFGMLMVIVAAADEPEIPEEPTEPAYTPVEYLIADLIAKAEAGEEIYLQPTDVILLEAAGEPDEPAEPEEPEVASAAAVDEPTEPDEPEAVLIVEYLPGEGAVSATENDRYVDFDGSGYAICAPGDYTDYAYKGTERRTGYAIDYANENEYAFKQWKVKTVYSGPEFNRIVLEADWDTPVLSGWEGFKAMMRGYLKTIIDYIIKYLQEWFGKLGDFFAGSAT